MYFDIFGFVSAKWNTRAINQQTVAVTSLKVASLNHQNLTGPPQIDIAVNPPTRASGPPPHHYLCFMRADVHLWLQLEKHRQKSSWSAFFILLYLKPSGRPTCWQPVRRSLCALITSRQTLINSRPISSHLTRAPLLRVFREGCWLNLTGRRSAELHMSRLSCWGI